MSLAIAALASGIVGAQSAQKAPLKIDKPSLHVGEITAFAELVGIGQKKLAFSDVLPPQEMDEILPEAMRIAQESHVLLYREPDLIVTDLFPADVAKGKEVLLIYKGATLDEYKALKQDKAALVKAGKYTGKAREEIARRLGKLLSYPDSGIEMLLKKEQLRE
jgi:hypothetical protein